MILPNNGKVVIIDDDPKDVIELIGALSKEKVPFVHYKEQDLSDLPDTPIENVRLIFLDLELLTDTYLPPKNITSPIKSRLLKVLKPNTTYALVIWSKKESIYKKALLEDFDSEFREYRPIFCTSLPKADVIGQGAKGIARLKRELETEIAKFQSFNAFLVWESIVNESAGRLTNDIVTLYSPDAEWDAKTKFLLYKLAVAYSGKAVNSFNDMKQLKNALYTLSLSFTDNVESAIDKAIDSKFSGLVIDAPKTVENFTPVINKLLLISESSDDCSQPGNIFFVEAELEKKFAAQTASYTSSMEKICTRLPVGEGRETAVRGLNEKYSRSKQDFEEKRDRFRKRLNDITYSALADSARAKKELKNVILEAARAVELLVTPFCDYAQEKAKLARVLPGAIVPSSYRSNFDGSPAYLYISDADFRFKDKDFFFLFDFRFLFSKETKELQNLSVNIRIKQQFLSDIQVKLGAHVIRSGVLYIN